MNLTHINMNTYPDKIADYSHPSTSSYIYRIAFPAGLAGGLSLIVYFLIIKALGYYMQTNLRWVNFLIVIPVMIYAINKYVNTATSKTYLETLVVSAISCIAAYFVLGIFMVGYLFYDTALMEYLYQSSLPELQLTQLSVFLIIMMEGIVGGIVLSFVFLQFFIDRIRKAA